MRRRTDSNRTKSDLPFKATEHLATVTRSLSSIYSYKNELQTTVLTSIVATRSRARQAKRKEKQRL